MRAYKKYFPAAFLVASLLLSGCRGKAAVGTVPELLEPVAVNAAYRPVELGMIGETKVLYGTVVPQEYCCFYDTNVGITEITVEIGDYVQKGDVVAYADIEQAKEELSNLNLELENVNQNHAIKSQIEQIRMKQINEREVPVQDVSGNLLPAADVSENRVDVEATQKLIAEKETELAIVQENYRYDGLLYEYRVSKLQEQINRQQGIVAEGTLKAPHSGYVVYIKGLGVSTEAAAFENIVVLADPKETYIELNDRTIDKYVYGDYEVKYLRLAGKEYEVTELSYGMDAELLAKASGKYPNVRLICPEAGTLGIGETYPVFFREKKLEEVPIIGLDSLNGEKDAYFVYVKGEDGERERRAVTIGESDTYYARVLSGLEVGEEVYYESESRMPDAYTEYTVELVDYRIENVTRSYDFADEQIIWYDALFAGTMKEIVVKEGEEVKAGDLLYVLRSDAGKAALTDAQNDINQEKLSYAENISQLNESLEKERNEDSKKILSLQIELENINHSYRLERLEKNYNEMAEYNNGTGEIAVYAKQSGTIGGIRVGEEDSVIAGSHILAMGNKKDDLLLVQMVEKRGETSYVENIADIGESVTITVGETDYRGTCVGRTGHRDTNLKKNYVSETVDGAAITNCTDSGYWNPAFYVVMEDESFYQNKGMGKVTFSYVSMEDVIAVPTAVVKEEQNAKNPTRTDYFVWRVVGDELVKQYVLVNKAYSDVNTTVILSGVEAGDILAKEK